MCDAPFYHSNPTACPSGHQWHWDRGGEALQARGSNSQDSLPAQPAGRARTFVPPSPPSPRSPDAEPESGLAWSLQSRESRAGSWVDCGRRGGWLVGWVMPIAASGGTKARSAHRLCCTQALRKYIPCCAYILYIHTYIHTTTSSSTAQYSPARPLRQPGTSHRP